MRGHASEGRRWLERFLARESSGSTEALLRTKALNAAGILAANAGAHDRATALFAESLAIRRERGDQPGVAATLGNLGNVAKERGNYG